MTITRTLAVFLAALVSVCFTAGQAWGRSYRHIESMARNAWDHVDELDLEFDRNFRPAAEYRLLLNTTDRMLDLLEDVEDDAACGQRWDRAEARLNDAVRRSRTLHVVLDRMDKRYVGCPHAWRGSRPYCSHRARTLLFAVDTMLAQLQEAVIRQQSCDVHRHHGPALHVPMPAPLPPPTVLPRHGSPYHYSPSSVRRDDRFRVQMGVHHGQPVISFGNSAFAIRLGGR